VFSCMEGEERAVVLGLGVADEVSHDVVHDRTGRSGEDGSSNLLESYIDRLVSALD
jgi:hypothetical protein